VRVAGIVIAVFVLLVGAYFTGIHASRASLPQSAVIVKAVQELSDLVTLKQSMSEVFRAESGEGGRLALIFGRDRLLLVAHGEVWAGIDLKELKAEDVVVVGDSVTVRLPRAKILGTKLVEEHTYVVDRNTGLLIRFDKDLERQARLYALEHFVSAARKLQLERQAAERARLLLENFLRQLGFKSVTVQA
jgi:hypothetical protein